MRIKYTKKIKKMEDEMKTLVVNLLGAAGSGKSVLAAKVFAELKIRGFNCEYVQEFAKDVVYEENFKRLHNQGSLLQNQYDRLDKLRGKVDIIVTDSPLPLSIFYNENFNKTDTFKIPDDIFNEIVKFYYSTFDNLNFFIKRNHQYKKEGRYQDESEVLMQEKQIYSMLLENGFDFKLLKSTDNCVDIIVGDVERRAQFYESLSKSNDEIERKFLVKYLPRGITRCKKEYIYQSYLATNTGEKRIRCINGEKFILTEKYGQGIQRNEYEKEISIGEYNTLSKQITGRTIKKVRYYYPLDNELTAEVDCYLEELDGLMVVEVEFDSLEKSNSFVKPDWFGDDVTFDAKYKNKELSRLSQPESLGEFIKK